MGERNNDAKHTPSHMLASHLRDMAKITYEPPADHIDRLYEAARIVESHSALVAQKEALCKSLTKTRDKLHAFVGALADVTDCSDDVEALNEADAALKLARGDV